MTTGNQIITEAKKYLGQGGSVRGGGNFYGGFETG